MYKHCIALVLLKHIIVVCVMIQSQKHFSFSCSQYPVLTLGDGLGSRVVLHEGNSAHSGDYVVEECDGSEGGEGVRVRRLVFLSSQHLAQTEVHMIPGMFY